MKTKNLTIALLQLSCEKDVEKNIKKTIDAAEKAARAGAQIICTQELFSSLYFCQSEDYENFNLAEPIPGKTTELFQKFAARRKVAIVVSMFEKRAAGIHHNSAVIIDANGDLLGVYRKMHIPDDPLYYEKFYFVPGDTGFKAWQTKYSRIGVLICWDQWFPEAARLTAMDGAEIIFYPTAIGWHPAEKESLGEVQHSAWETIQRAHAIANGCFVAAVNRVGFEKLPNTDGLQFWGQSFICDPFGKIIAKASPDKEETLIATLDLELIHQTRVHWPFFRDRRIDAYCNILKRWGS